MILNSPSRPALSTPSKPYTRLVLPLLALALPLAACGAPSQRGDANAATPLSFGVYSPLFACLGTQLPPFRISLPIVPYMARLTR